MKRRNMIIEYLEMREVILKRLYNERLEELYDGMPHLTQEECEELAILHDELEILDEKPL